MKGEEEKARVRVRVSERGKQVGILGNMTKAARTRRHKREN